MKDQTLSAPEPNPDKAETADGNRRSAHILLTDDALIGRDLGRYLFILVTYLRLTGHEVILWGRGDLESRLNAQKWAQRLIDDNNVHLKDSIEGPARTTANDILVLTGDVPSGRFAGLKQFRLVKGRRLTFQPQAYDVLFPYMLHPKFYTGGRYLKVPQYREQKRNIGLFFSGNYDERYRNADILAKYGTLQRPRDPADAAGRIGR